MGPYGRFCEGCGSKMPPFFPRKRDDGGDLLCATCLDRKATSRAAAQTHYFRHQHRVAHDSGDGETIFHCPFCGAGQVVGRSDGTVECQFCDTAFTVQVQPQQSAQPQTIGGEPHMIPDMPEGSTAGEEEEETELDPEDAEVDMDDLGTDPAEEGNPFMERKQNPFQSSYHTASGASLSEDDYIRHLAIRHAADRDRVIAEVRSTPKEG